MPRFDGTGPDGQGPRTGRGKGDCKPPHIRRFRAWRQPFSRFRRFIREDMRVIGGVRDADTTQERDSE